MFQYYNMNQVVLPLDLEIKLKENDIAFHIHHLVNRFLMKRLKPSCVIRVVLPIILV